MGTASISALPLRTAALIAGLAYLFDPVSYAEFTLYPKLVVSGHIAQTVTNISTNHGAFLMMFFFYFINFAEDIVVAWALYYLFAPVNRAVSALAALFQLVYAGIAIVGLLNLATVFHMVTQPEYLASLGSGPLHAEVNILLHTFRTYYSFGLLLFAVHLILIGALIVRASYVPWWIGVALIVDGAGWIVTELQPYLYPSINVDFLFFTFFGELLFMLWLLIVGWRLQEPAAAPVRAEPALSG